MFKEKLQFCYTYFETYLSPNNACMRNIMTIRKNTSTGLKPHRLCSPNTNMTQPAGYSFGLMDRTSIGVYHKVKNLTHPRQNYDLTSTYICRFKSFFRADLDSVGSLAGSYTAAGSSLAGGSPQSDIFDESSLEVAVVKLKEPGARNPAGICADTLTQSAAGFTRLYFVRARTLFVAAFNTFKGFVLLCSFLFFN